MHIWTWAACIGAAATVAAGCATGYHEQNYLGFGYSERRIDANTVRVSFRGDENTPRRQVERSALYRAAEYTLAEGFDRFVVVDTWDKSDVGITNEGPVDDISYHRSYDSLRTFPYETYRITYEIDLYRSGAELPDGVQVFDPEDVMATWEPSRRDSPRENFDDDAETQP